MENRYRSGRGKRCMSRLFHRRGVARVPAIHSSGLPTDFCPGRKTFHSEMAHLSPLMQG
jgi:hypothetical protein